MLMSMNDQSSEIEKKQYGTEKFLNTKNQDGKTM